MSVDDQLRAAFAEPDELWEPRADLALREVRRRLKTRVASSARRGLAAGALAAAVHVTGVVLVSGDRLSGDAAPDPAETPRPTHPGRTVLARDAGDRAGGSSAHRTPRRGRRGVRRSGGPGDGQYADRSVGPRAGAVPPGVAGDLRDRGVAARHRRRVRGAGPDYGSSSRATR